MSLVVAGDRGLGGELLRGLPDVRALERRRGHPRLSLIMASLPGGIAVLIAIFGPWLTPHSPVLTITGPYLNRTQGLPLGSDYLGRDVLSRVLAGGRDLLVLPLVTTALATTIGVVVGIGSGYLGGRLDSVFMRVSDVFLAMPGFLVLLVIVSGWGGSEDVLVFAVVFTGWPFIARLARAATLQVAGSAYVEQARGQGESSLWVISREVLPNIGGPLIANAGLFLVGSFYLVASLSFLGFVSGGAGPNWAVMINENSGGVALSPYGVVVPVLLIAALAISANLLVDRLARRLNR